MTLTNKQEEGLRCILARHKAGEKYTVISGYAGSGKSTLVKFAIDALNVESHKVAYAAYTGKAAEVLRKKGNSGACTLHKLLYDHYPLSGGGFFRKPKTFLEEDIIVVDEVSMVPQPMIDMLLRHKVYIIFLGDPFQLPPVLDKGESGNTLLQRPHVFLDEIMRQAAESEIIRLTMKIRNYEDIGFFKGDEVQVLKKSENQDKLSDIMLWADQILVGTNAVRTDINDAMRILLGFEGAPQHGERIVCRRNYWDECNEQGDALVNGTTGILLNPFKTFRRIPVYIPNDRRDLPVIQGDFLPDNGAAFNSVEIDRDYIETGIKCVDWRVAYKLGKLKPKLGDIVPKEFEYAYAVTTHRAQGSSWEKVLVVEENFPFKKEEHARWLYTSCTRPEKKLVLLRP